MKDYPTRKEAIKAFDEEGLKFDDGRVLAYVSMLLRIWKKDTFSQFLFFGGDADDILDALVDCLADHENISIENLESNWKDAKRP